MEMRAPQRPRGASLGLALFSSRLCCFLCTSHGYPKGKPNRPGAAQNLLVRFRAFWSAAIGVFLVYLHRSCRFGLRLKNTNQNRIQTMGIFQSVQSAAPAIMQEEDIHSKPEVTSPGNLGRLFDPRSPGQHRSPIPGLNNIIVRQQATHVNLGRSSLHVV